MYLQEQLNDEEWLLQLFHLTSHSWVITFYVIWDMTSHVGHDLCNKTENHAYLWIDSTKLAQTLSTKLNITMVKHGCVRNNLFSKCLSFEIILCFHTDGKQLLNFNKLEPFLYDFRSSRTVRFKKRQKYLQWPKMDNPYFEKRGLETNLLSWQTSKTEWYLGQLTDYKFTKF